MSSLEALIIAAHGRHYLAEVNLNGDIQRIQCVTRGKKSDVAVGDRVSVKMTSKDQAVIESIMERKTLLFRSDQYKSKMLAANVSRLFIVVATEPAFSDDLVSRALVAANAAEIEVHILLNKVDIESVRELARARVDLYRSLGYPVHEVSIKMEQERTHTTLMNLMDGHTSLLIGQSGMGKSSLINLMIPDADIATREISAALDTGKHTTTFTRLYHLNQQSHLIDSPGFQEFGLHHLSEGVLERAFPEFQPHLGKCKFYNCHHHAEPGCAILDAVAKGQINENRHALFEQLVHESSQVIGYKN